MDKARFDDLVKSVARTTSRRGVLRLLVGGIAGGIFSSNSNLAAATEIETLAAPKLACPDCGTCTFCDADAEDGGCVPCTKDPCLASTLCDRANADILNGRLRTSLEKRGFVPDGEPEAVVVVAGGTPSGTRAALGTHYKHSEREGEEAFLYFIPWPEVGGDSVVTVLRKGEAFYGLVIGEDGRVAKIEAENASLRNTRDLRTLRQVSRECSKCYDMCDDLNSATGNAVACTLFGAAACSRIPNLYGGVACGIITALICNGGSASCYKYICENLQGCPPVCDPTCENTDPSTGKCVDICTKANTKCTNRRCECKYVECGETCCGEGQVCKDGQCADDCGPCSAPNNEGRCFDLCAKTITHEAAGECCVSDDNPDGVCCLSRERCCGGVCQPIGACCDADPGATCCPPDHPWPHLLEPYCCTELTSFPVELGGVDCIPWPGS
jgi:hypothetical protein